MESDDEESDDWSKPVGDNVPTQAKTLSPANKHPMVKLQGVDHSRVVLHIDIDCFYAQVEMIRNPELRNKPLGIQQKYIVVTCNYPARERGVTKLMLIKDAKEKCPDLVLVSGEDLTHYREMSYKISGYLQKYCTLVERLGFDENFLDITELVNDRLAKTVPKEELEVKGHLYDHESIQVSSTCGCGCHRRLLAGSHVAADIREGLYSELGITCCGGVAHNKLLSKLVAGAHKPNQQTTLLPEQTATLMGKLTSVRNIPGIGHSTAKRLKEMGIVRVQDLLEADSTGLEEEFGLAMAHTMKKLCEGVDDSPVMAFGLPQTLSDEDSFKKCCKFEEVKLKIRQLLTSLLERLLKDGRTPHTLRLTVRKLNKGYSRESRQCNIPSSIFNKFTPDMMSKVCSQLETLALGLFTKMVDPQNPFHLTLINVAFAKLEQKSGNAITQFFSPKKLNTTVTQSESPQKVCMTDESSSGEVNDSETKHSESFETYQVSKIQKRKVGITKWFSSPEDDQKELLKTGGQITNINNKYKLQINEQDDIQVNIDLVSQKKCDSMNAQSTKGGTSFFQKHKRKSSSSIEDSCHKRAKLSTSRMQGFSNKTIPSHIDRAVFLELPPDIQREILMSNSTASGDNQSQKAENMTNNQSKAVPVEKNEAEVIEIHDNAHCNFTKFNETKGATSDRTDASIGHEETEVSDSNTVEILTPPDIDRSVFVNLPADIQQELIREWKSKTKLPKDSSNSLAHFKMPKPSSSNNILSYFSKSSKQ